MPIEIWTGLFGLIGTVFGSILSWLIQKDRMSADLKIAIESTKTEYMAEKAARHFLNNQKYTDRSFELIKKRLGGFEDDELRKILVRAGAARHYRDDGTEYWRLLERDIEAINSLRKKEGRSEYDSTD